MIKYLLPLDQQGQLSSELKEDIIGLQPIQSEELKLSPSNKADARMI